jgi:hypothetical protein
VGTKWDVVGGGGEKGKQNAQKSFIHDSSARAAVLALPLHPNFMVVLEVVLAPLNKSPLMPAVGLMGLFGKESELRKLTKSSRARSAALPEL